MCVAFSLLQMGHVETVVAGLFAEAFSMHRPAHHIWGRHYALGAASPRSYTERLSATSTGHSLEHTRGSVVLGAQAPLVLLISMLGNNGDA